MIRRYHSHGTIFRTAKFVERRRPSDRHSIKSSEKLVSSFCARSFGTRHGIKNRGELVSCLSAAAGTGAFIYLLRHGRSKIFSQASLADFTPSSLRGATGLCPCAGKSRPLPAAQNGMPPPSCVIPFCAHGRKRYNTLDLTSKVVCHGAVPAPLDSPDFRSPWVPKLLNPQFAPGLGNAKSSNCHP